MSPLQHVCLLFSIYAYSSACMSSLQHKCLLFSIYAFSSAYMPSLQHVCLLFNINVFSSACRSPLQNTSYHLKFYHNRNTISAIFAEKWAKQEQRKIFHVLFFLLLYGIYFIPEQGSCSSGRYFDNCIQKRNCAQYSGTGGQPSCFHCPDAGSQIFMFPSSGCRESDLHVSIVRMQGVQVLKCLKRAAFAGFLFRNEQTSSEKAQDGGNRLPLREQSRAGADCFFKKP